MGYTLIIGEAIICWRATAEVEVEIENHEAAPAFGEPTDYENQRWPGYGAWSDFCRALGIMDLMFDERDGGAEYFEVEGIWLRPLIAEHPGHTVIKQGHLDFLRGRIAAYRAAHPTHFAQYPPVKEGFEDKGLWTPSEHRVDDPKYDGNLCRAEWLDYWMSWALGNCEHPVFVNY